MINMENRNSRFRQGLLTILTALMLASKNGNLSALKILLENGADPKRRNSDGNNSIALARLAKHNETANYIESFNKNTKLFNMF